MSRGTVGEAEGSDGAFESGEAGGEKDPPVHEDGVGRVLLPGRDGKA